MTDPLKTAAFPRGMPPDVNAWPSPAGEMTDELDNGAIWSDELISEAGIPQADIDLVTIGGGLGSFALADTLRVAGCDRRTVLALGANADPIDTYRTLARNSQIPDHERLRSDASSTIDNIWGFPSYAVREAIAEKSPVQLARVITEPLVMEYFTPKASQVYRGLDREAARIGWPGLIRTGTVRTVRRHVSGGYVTVFTPATGNPHRGRIAVRSRYVHIAVGYPALRLLPDLQQYRTETGDVTRVTNAYEPHEYVYEQLRAHGGGRVVVRGNGIVASRILQRLLDDREATGADIEIVHLFRNFVEGPQGGSARFRRPGSNGFAYQAFNFPKAAWGGQLKERLEQLDGAERANLIRAMGGTNTAPRSGWKKQLAAAGKAGCYRQVVGSVVAVAQSQTGGVLTRINTATESIEIDASFVLDATGIDATVEEHRILRDVLTYCNGMKNPFGRLEVSTSFEVPGTRSGNGKMYASGSATLGGPYAGVDSFLGLQYAALQIADDLASEGFCERIGSLRSVRQWWRWMRNRTPEGRRSTAQGAAS